MPCLAIFKNQGFAVEKSNEDEKHFISCVLKTAHRSCASLNYPFFFQLAVYNGAYFSINS